MRQLLILFLTCLAGTSYGQKKISLPVNVLPVRSGILYKPQAKIGDIRRPVNGAEISTTQDSCFALTDGLVSAVFDLGDEFACVVRYSNNLLVTYSGLGNLNESIEKGQTIRKGRFIGLLNKINDKNILNFMITNQKGINLAFEKIVAFIKKNMPDKHAGLTLASVY